MSRRGWEAAVAEHRASLEGFLRAARSLPAERWSAPLRAGGWSPAQVAEHLSLVYEAVLRELAGGAPLAPRLTGWQQTLSRWVVLPHILFHRSFPVRVRAPREVRPADPPAASGDREAGLGRLGGLGDRFVETVTTLPDRESRTVSHPYFGRVGLRRSVRFAAAHVEHHTRQISG
jgi:hypothetical protein